ncbi:MAG: hypothetical protein H6978_06345 [Gammaproteobacteria bacterium]|nr:hypothetical protein [Gammaproteobacteria bacterium]
MKPFRRRSVPVRAHGLSNRGFKRRNLARSIRLALLLGGGATFSQQAAAVCELPGPAVLPLVTITGTCFGTGTLSTNTFNVEPASLFYNLQSLLVTANLNNLGTFDNLGTLSGNGAITNNGTFLNSGAMLSGQVFTNNGTAEFRYGSDVFVRSSNVVNTVLTGGIWDIGISAGTGGIHLNGGNPIRGIAADLTLRGRGAYLPELLLRDNQGSITLLSGALLGTFGTKSDAFNNDGTISIGGDSIFAVSGSMQGKGTLHNDGWLLLEDVQLADEGRLNNNGIVESHGGDVAFYASDNLSAQDKWLTGGTWRIHSRIGQGSFAIGPAISIERLEADVLLSGEGVQFGQLDGLRENYGVLTLEDGAALTMSNFTTNAGSLVIGAGSTVTLRQQKLGGGATVYPTPARCSTTAP